MIKKVKLKFICDIYSAGDKPKNFSEFKTDKLNIPVYGNGRDNEGLVGFTDKAGVLSKAVTVAARGSSCGVAFYRAQPYMPIVRLLSLIAKPGIDTKYLYYQVCNRHFKGIGSGQPQITIPDIADAPIYLETELKFQESISRVLSCLDEKIVNNNVICANLESMAKLLYDYWFVQFDFPDENGRPYKSSGGKMVWNEELKREIPEGWEVKHASDLTKVRTGKEDANFATVDGNYAYFTCGQDILKCDFPSFEGRAVLLAGNGDFNVKHYTGKFNAYQRTYVLIPDDEKYYALLYIATKEAIKKFVRGSAGSIVKFITLGDVNGISLLDPHDDNVLKKFNLILDKIEQIRDENEQLASLRDFLLPMLMNGQVKIRE